MAHRVIVVACFCAGCYGTTDAPPEPTFRPLCGEDEIERCEADPSTSRSGIVEEILIAVPEPAGDPRVVDGADLDCRADRSADSVVARCGHVDRVDPSGNAGIDNQFGPAHSALLPHHPSWPDGRALEVIGPPSVDGCATVNLGTVRGTGGRVEARGPLRVIEARLSEVPLEIPVTIVHDGREVRDEIVRLTLRDVAIRLPIAPTTTEFTALMVGSFLVDEIVPAYVSTDPDYLPDMLVQSIASSQADLAPGTDGVCREVSAAFVLRGRWAP